MKIFLDDIRDAPDFSWTVLREVSVVRSVICTYLTIEEISFDHDLGEDQPTGYDLLSWIEKMFAHGNHYGIHNCKFSIHSANPVGRKNMEAAIRSIERFR